MKLTKLFAPAIALALFATTVNAGVVSIDTNQSPAEAAGAGYIANDILVNFDGNLRGQQLYVQLTSGSVYQETSFGGETAPNSALIGVEPAIEFDSFVTIGGVTSQTSEDVLVVGGAVDIPGAPSDKTFDDGQVISMAWAPAAGVDIGSGTNYPVARITLTPDANGDAWVFASTSGTDDPFLSRRSVINGVIVPEPASLALISLAMVGVVGLRRRS